MRAKQRNLQTIYLGVITKVPKYDEHGDETGEYTKTETKGQSYKCSVSVKGVASIEKAGIVPNYDRVITIYKKTSLKEGDRLFVDSDTACDYVIETQITTDKGLVSRYGIKKLV